jgi:hypothetical protein
VSFYLDTIRKLVNDGKLDTAAPTLIVAGGETDRKVMLEAGFTDVTISNLDVRMKGHEFAPFKWAFLDGEELAVEPGAYAQIIEHMGLHHCGSPHRGLLEMYRCAGKSVLVFENRDSFAMQTAVKLGMVPVYEFEAVVDNDYRYGGYRNTAVPNAVYRWNEQEVTKILASYDPAYHVPVRFFYGLRLPVARVKMIRSPLVRALFLASFKPFELFAKIFPSQMNEFGFFIDKAGRNLQPWMASDGNEMSREFWAKGKWKEPSR